MNAMALTAEPVQTPEQARQLICLLARRFYELGWVSGTGGGISLRLRNAGDDRVFMAPSGVQKEMLDPSMIYTLDLRGEVLSGPASDVGMSVSQCRPLFVAAMTLRDAGAVIHSHSKNCVLATLLFDGHVPLSHLEMLKGLAGVGFEDLHRVPIIDNTAQECDLTDAFVDAIVKNPGVHAVLVRRHGLYVWGHDWLEAKRHAECYDYLLGIAVEMKRLGIDPGAPTQR